MLQLYRGELYGVGTPRECFDYDGQLSGRVSPYCLKHIYRGGGMSAIATAVATMIITCDVHVNYLSFSSGHLFKHFYIKFVAFYNFETPVVV